MQKYKRNIFNLFISSYYSLVIQKDLEHILAQLPKHSRKTSGSFKKLQQVKAKTY